jgi:hypothetical protein
MRVLDGLRFILWQEEVSRPGGAAQPPRPVAANLSYGVHGGPHDGSSMFEAAALELLEQNPQLHLVLPVGNAHRARCHRRGELAPHDATGCRMACKVLPDSGRDTYLEIWVDAAADLRVEILPPGHIQALVVTKNQAKVYVAPLGSDAQPTLQFGAIYPASVAQGANGTMVLIAICPTRALGDAGGLGLNQLPRRRIGAPHGVWQITVVNQGAAATRFDAWIERGDAAPDSARGSRQAYFIELTPSDTLNGIATFRHPRLHVVGAMRELDGRLADYSAAGPRRGDALRDQGPDVVVKADRSGHLAGLRTGGFVSGSHAVYAHWLGTSLGSSPPSLPAGPLPPTATAEVSCSAELGPRATDAQRGQARRMVTPPGVGPSRL